MGEAVYSGCKGAIIAFSKTLARELARNGINVNVVQPGYIHTDIMGEWFSTDAGRQQIRGFHRRRLLKPEALDDLILYLSSDASIFVTGTVIDIDDGQSL